MKLPLGRGLKQPGGRMDLSAHIVAGRSIIEKKSPAFIVVPILLA